MHSTRLVTSLVVLAVTVPVTWSCRSMEAPVHSHDTSPSASSRGDAVRVLIFSKTSWYRHPAIPEVNGFLCSLGRASGFLVDVTETSSDLSAGRLAQYDVLVLNSTTNIGESLTDEEKAGVIEWFRKGGGIVGLHAALVHHDTWPWFAELGGCGFNSDSEFVKARLIVDPAATEHPAVKGHGPAFSYTADWTNHDRSVTGLPGVKVLLRIDETSYEPVRDYFKTRGGKPMGKDHPVSWIREWEGGRFFYTELAHEIRSIDTKFGRQHLVEGIRWAAGD